MPRRLGTTTRSRPPRVSTRQTSRSRSRNCSLHSRAWTIRTRSIETSGERQIGLVGERGQVGAFRRPGQHALLGRHDRDHPLRFGQELPQIRRGIADAENLVAGKVGPDGADATAQDLARDLAQARSIKVAEIDDVAPHDAQLYHRLSKLHDRLEHAHESAQAVRAAADGRLEIQQVPCLTDNYAYLLHEPASGSNRGGRPVRGRPLIEAARARGWRLTHILNTHHHWDHIGGNLALKEATGGDHRGSGARHRAHSRHRRGRRGGRAVSPWLASAEILFIPGHTRGHIAFHFEESQALFCGDTLFALGCGRLFEGSPEECGIPSRSCAACRPKPGSIAAMNIPRPTPASRSPSIRPTRRCADARARGCRAARAKGCRPCPPPWARSARPTRSCAPTSRRSPQAIDLPRASPVEVFAEIRRRKDRF